MRSKRLFPLAVYLQRMAVCWMGIGPERVMGDVLTAVLSHSPLLPYLLCTAVLNPTHFTAHNASILLNVIGE
ncbi:MAG TPA: hypothetical protein PLD25_30850 [Chloroflexota bacterium]|nr:hypothetical protein [Chloroflexota bacterium]HUM71827.1 hypothetical protein [Chloroflexota bacterium]